MLMKGPPRRRLALFCENQFCLLSEAKGREQKSNGFTQHDIITIPIVWLKMAQTAFLGSRAL